MRASSAKRSRIAPAPVPAKASAPRSDRRDRAVWIAPLCVLVLFAPTLRFGFLGLDDANNILTSPFAQAPFASMLAGVWSAPFEGLYIPLTYSYWGALWRIAGGPAAPLGGLADVAAVFHAGNVLLHALNTALVFRLLRSWGAGVAAALAGALIFGLHPLQVEPVAWITGAKDLLSATFALLALVVLAPWTGAAGAPPPLSGRRCALATTAFAAAMLAKPSHAVLPLILAALAGLGPARGVPRRLKTLLGVMVAVAAVLTAITMAHHPDEGVTFLPTLAQRPLVAGDALTFYLGKLLAPVGLAIDYGRAPEVVLARPGVWATAAVPCALALACALLYRRRGHAAPGRALAVFFLALLPTAGLVSFQFQVHSTVADRYAYLAMLGAAMAAAGLVAKLPPRWRLAAAGAPLLLAVLSWRQERPWQDDLAIAHAALAVNPGSRLAVSNVGNFGLIPHFYRQVEPATAMLRQAVAEFPQSDTAAFNLCSIYRDEGRHAEAIPLCEAAAKLKPDWDLPLINLAMMSAAAKNYAEAERLFRAAIARNPRSFAGWLTLAMILAGSGRQEEAIKGFREAARLEPENPEPWAHLRELALRAGDAAGAAAAEQQMARLGAKP